MEIKIENFQNIKKLDLSLENNKINFIYGVSGSGKSSVAKAIKGEINSNNVSYGKNLDDVNLIVSPHIGNDDYSLFDENVQQNLLINKDESNEIYSIVFSNDKKIDEIKQEINMLLSNINSKRIFLNEYVSNVLEMIKKINGRKFRVKEKFSSSSSIERIKEEINNPQFNKYSKFIRNHGPHYLKWIKEGASFSLYYNDKCPFCTRKLTVLRKKKIEEIINVEPENYKIITDSEDLLRKLGITVPNFSYKREIAKLDKDLNDAISNKNIIINILNMIDSYSYNNFDIDTIKKIEISESLKKLFPDLESTVIDFNLNLKKLKSYYGKLKINTSKLVKDNLKILNDYLEKFSIHYKFEIDSYNISDKKAKVFLVSTIDKKHFDRTENLSYGERNLIALLLFLISNNKKVVVIDDPASSYDDNRRKIIYELIYKLHNNKTILILSHDQVFIKYAILGVNDKRNKLYKENTGRIICIENHFGQCKEKEILVEDIGPLNAQIIKFINSNKMPYYRKIINLRILAEIFNNSTEENNIIYCYLSAILHKKDRKIIKKELSEKRYTEKEVLKLIENKYSIKLKKIPEDIMLNFNYDNLTNFEKIAFKREEARILRNNSRRYIKKSFLECEFDDIVHLNTKYFVSLNPYKFDIFSEYIYKNI